MTELDLMLAGIRDAERCTTKLEAGQVLTQAGWAIFPLPDNQKFDQGFSYLHATCDPSRWTEMSEYQMQRSECHDVNIALAPGRCAVPLLVVDLDGMDAMWRFFEDCKANGFSDISGWLRVNTTRTDTGRHMYFVSPGGEQYSNSSHRWGGEIRSGRGHVVMPPSTTQLGRYTWTGTSLYTAPAWILEGLHAARGMAGGERNLDDNEIEVNLDLMSLWSWTSYGNAAAVGLLGELAEARPGDPNAGRNATLARVVFRMLDLALARQVPAVPALGRIAEVYEPLFAGEGGRDPDGEVVRCVRSWMSNKEELEEQIAQSAQLADWVVRQGGGDMEVADGMDSDLMTKVRQTGIEHAGKIRRRAVNNWMEKENK